MPSPRHWHVVCPAWSPTLEILLQLSERPAKSCQVEILKRWPTAGGACGLACGFSQTSGLRAETGSRSTSESLRLLKGPLLLFTVSSRKRVGEYIVPKKLQSQGF